LPFCFASGLRLSPRPFHPLLGGGTPKRCADPVPIEAVMLRFIVEFKRCKGTFLILYRCA
jgi:hypothetical protein